MKRVTELGTITVDFAAALLKEQAFHPSICLHCKYKDETEKGGKEPNLVHEGNCPVALARFFLAELSKELPQN